MEKSEAKGALSGDLHTSEAHKTMNNVDSASSGPAGAVDEARTRLMLRQGSESTYFEKVVCVLLLPSLTDEIQQHPYLNNLP